MFRLRVEIDRSGQHPIILDGSDMKNLLGHLGERLGHIGEVPDLEKTMAHSKKAVFTHRDCRVGR